MSPTWTAGPEPYGRRAAAATQIRVAVLVAHAGIVTALLTLTQRASVTRPAARQAAITLFVVPRTAAAAALPHRPVGSVLAASPAVRREPALQPRIAQPAPITAPDPAIAATPPEPPASALQLALPPGWPQAERQAQPWQSDPRANSRPLDRDARLGRAIAPADADREETSASDRTQVHVKGGCFEMPRNPDPFWNHPQAVQQNCE